jgi:outer membrane protein OmpA-like peptidoglycan-associated protein
MSTRGLLLPLVLAAAALLAACATPHTQVVLLPQSDGTPSAVVVSTASGARTLSEPYERATAEQGAAGAPKLDKADPERLKHDNPSLFDLMPPPVQRYTVYFEAGGTVLTASSQVAMNDALNAALARSGGEIVVTGHTDTVGTLAHNDELSRQRAEQVRQLFLARNFPPERVEAVGRGKRELAVKTGDEVAEPLNRRVTIEVR